MATRLSNTATTGTDTEIDMGICTAPPGSTTIPIVIAGTTQRRMASTAKRSFTGPTMGFIVAQVVFTRETTTSLSFGLTITPDAGVTVFATDPVGGNIFPARHRISPLADAPTRGGVRLFFYKVAIRVIPSLNLR